MIDSHLPEYDVLFAGGGLANGLIAWRLKALRPSLKIGLIEQDSVLGGNHTWSFHDDDLTSHAWEWITPLVVHRWPAYEVRFPGLSRRMPGGYASVTAERFDAVLRAALEPSLMLNTAIESVAPTVVQLADGRTLRAAAVIDGRGPVDSTQLILGRQVFLGQEVSLHAPHGLSGPIVMDATVAQEGGYRFVYVLPLAHRRVLIEDTHYVDADCLPSADSMRSHVAEYARSRGWQIMSLHREEMGALPITLAGDFDAFWDAHPDQPRAGLSAGLFHPTTGYSLPHAVRLADAVASMSDLSAAALHAAIRSHAAHEWREQRFFRLLNRMLFLAGKPEHRWCVMRRFYGLSEGLIRRFYAQQLRWDDQARILLGKPPVPVGAAVRAALRSRPHSFG